MLADPDEVDGELTKVLVKLPETGRQILTGLDVVYDRAGTDTILPVAVVGFRPDTAFKNSNRKTKKQRPIGRCH